MENIDWYVGLKVWDVRFGAGEVIEDAGYGACGITVKFDCGTRTTYNTEGKYRADEHQSLFFSEPKIDALRVPPKRFKPKLKEGDEIVFTYIGTVNINVRVVSEDEDSIAGAELINGALTSVRFHKSNITSIRLVNTTPIEL